jgi:hypothetical protein
LTEERKQTLGIELRNLVQHLKNYKPVEVSSPVQTEQPKLPKCSCNNDHELLSALDCVELKYMPEMSRYISATRDIQPGKIIQLTDCTRTKQF